MAKDDKDIDEMIRRIDSLQENRRRQSSNKRSFAEEFAAGLDRENLLRGYWGQRPKEQFQMAGRSNRWPRKSGHLVKETLNKSAQETASWKFYDEMAKIYLFYEIFRGI